MKRIGFALVVLAMAAAPAAAEIEDAAPDGDLCNGTVGGGRVEAAGLSVGTPALTGGVIVPIADETKGPFYLDIRDVVSAEHRVSVWLFAESNSVGRLQRGASRLLPGPAPIVEHVCVESVQPDTIVF